MKTYSPKPDHIQRRWYVMDADGQVLGRLATEVATLLRGKHKPMFAPHMDTGDHVIVVNADKVELTGNKPRDKFAYYHSGYPGGIRAVSYGELVATRPIAAIERAVRGMLPKNTLGRQMLKKLHVVAGPEHPHTAQRPVAIKVGERPVWEGLPTPTAKATPAKKAAKRAADAEEDGSPAEAPAAKKPTAKKPTANKPTAKKPTANKPTAKKPTAKKPTAKAPAAKKPTAKKPRAKKPKTEE
jgi:large subunit ribosomal protein L13